MKKLRSLLLILLCLTLVFPAALTACADKKADIESTEIKIGVLKGATGIGASKLKKDSDDKVTTGKYNITFYETASVGNLTKDIVNGTVDIAALPINTAAALYNETGKVQVIAANALGVLSIIGKEEISSIADLKGKTIHTTGRGATPEYILNFLLKENGLTPGTDVTVEFYADGGKAGSAAVKEGGVAMIPEPATTTLLNKNSALKLLFNVTEEWNKISDTKLIQGVLVVNKDFAENHKAALDNFIKEYKASIGFMTDEATADEAAALTVEYKLLADTKIASESIKRSGITCLTGKNMKKDVSAMLSVLFNANADSIKGKLPEKDFYYV